MVAETAVVGGTPVIEDGYPPARRAWTASVILTLGCILAFMDRGILSLFVVPIQRDLHLSDTEMGMVLGFAFGVFNAVFGLPMGRWVDVGNRKRIAALGVLVWSVANGACGLATSFWQLFVARTAVGIGESAVSPAGVSLIADYFPPGRRGRPMGLFYSGMKIGTGGVLLFGGLLWYSIGDRLLEVPIFGVLHSWQAILLGFAAIGFVVAPLTLMIAEPPRLTQSGGLASSASVADTLGFYRRHARALVGHNVGFCFNNFAIHASGWLPALLMRSQGWTLVQAGLVYGTMLIVVAPVGAISAGLLGDRLLQRGHPDGRLRVAIAATCGVGLSGLAIGVVSDPYLIALALVCFAFFASFGLPLGPSALQDAVPNTMRGQAIAIYVLVTNVIAGGAAAVTVGLITQHVLGDAARVNEAFAIVAVVSCAGAALVLYASLRPFRRLVEAQVRAG
ncbi:MFS transporter [Sphingomonas corticis]|uniref:MFS transporter n=1 Tax=Sphingomonas corticis TaxID=2722791 RepID=A0ABX1CSV1_9SPHN|nr:MFS transporter [Sphingomonas corticis]NJR80604.1 MFS transporter [Sphingomonas corticis]